MTNSTVSDSMIHFFADLRAKRSAGQLRDADLSPRALAEVYHGDVQHFLTDLIILLQEFRNDVSYQRNFSNVPPVAVTSDWNDPVTTTTSAA